jgi:KDO2-lipid IV(A) lauroyltransferase
VHLEGNYAVIARMARKTNALIYPVYIVREAGAQFALTALKPFRLPEIDAEQQLIQDVKQLNAVIEPLVRSHAEQWYFVDNRL